MKKWTRWIAAVLMVCLCMTGCGSAGSSDRWVDEDGNEVGATTDPAATTEPPAPKNLLNGKHHAKNKIKDYCTISVELDADEAPITVTNFVNLANDGFYDGLTFHRIIKGFMMQGGDPNGDGTGGSEQTIKGEFKANSVGNTLSHTRGTISMARSDDYNSASSQFFIMHEDSTQLDTQYAAFGHVTKGMDIVDEICENTPTTDSNGTVPKGQQPVIKTIKIVD